MKFGTLLVSLLIAVSSQAKTIEIKMMNNTSEGIMAFDPPFVQAAPGDTVKFVPTDKSHIVESYFVPTGAKSWKGEIDKPVTVKVEKEGVYLYTCQPHAPMAMVGVIQVGKATNLAEAQKAATAYSAKFVMNKDRLSKYMAKVK